MIHLIVDSTAAIPEDFLKKHENVHVVYLTLSVNGQYIPEKDYSIHKVITYCEAENKNIPTSQPSTGDYLSLFQQIPEKDPIIVICLTSGVSGTYNGALLAAKQSNRKNIRVINSRTTAIGMMQLVLDALDLIETGKSLDEITAQLQSNASRIRSTFTIATLDYLRRGGRIGKAAGLIGSILKIRPVIFLNENNEVDVLAKVRTEKKAVAAMLDYLHKNSPCKRIGIVHLENEEGGEKLRKLVQAEYPGIEVTLTTGTPVLTCYLGPGLLGIIFESAE